MGYQSGLLGAVGSVGSSISIATLLHRQSPEYQVKVEKEKLKAQAIRQKNEADFLKETAGRGFEYNNGKLNEKQVVTLDRDERRNAALEFQESNYDVAKQNYMIDPDPKYINDALKANTRANEAAKRMQDAQQAMEQEKEQKRQKDAWRSMSTNMGMNLGEITDRLGPKAEEIVKKELTK